MTNAQIVFLVLFVAVSVIHLFFCFIENEKYRRISKPFCVSLLTIFACCSSVGLKFFYIPLAALLGAAGDVLLIWKHNKKCFVLGAGLFGIGHIGYLTGIIVLLSKFITIPVYVYPIILVGLIGLAILISPLSKKYCGKVALPGTFYILFLVTTLVFSIILCCYRSFDVYSLLVFIGYLLFIASDSFLTFTTFIKDVKRRDFYIMLTYLSAEFLIVFGLLNALILL